MDKKKVVRIIGIVIGLFVALSMFGAYMSLLSDPSSLDEEFITIYSCLSNSSGVEIASEYDSSEEGVHPIILIQSNGIRHAFTDEVPKEWWPKNIINVELVLVCHKEVYKILEICHYFGAPSITRYQYYINASLREAKTGVLLSETTIEGTPPRECRTHEPYGLTELWGEHVTIGQINDWLTPYVIT